MGAMKLPPPDPNESFGMPPDQDVPMLAPAVVHLSGTPSAEVGRLSSALLAWRPGALIVLSCCLSSFGEVELGAPSVGGAPH